VTVELWAAKMPGVTSSRRNDSLIEIERRRARRSVQEVEDAEFKVIEAPKGKSASVPTSPSAQHRLFTPMALSSS
jgi:hypothetical protein